MSGKIQQHKTNNPIRIGKVLKYTFHPKKMCEWPVNMQKGAQCH